jgi:FMN reductase
MTEPFSIAIVTGSPSKASRTAALADLVAHRLQRDAFRVCTIAVRDLPSDALLQADFADPAIVQATAAIAQADGVVIASPVYKASYTGVLKTFLDLLPARALSGKVVLPLLTGGTLAHALALDYGLRPVLQALEPTWVVNGLFLLDKAITPGEHLATLEAEAVQRLDLVTDSFVESVRLVAQGR